MPKFRYSDGGESERRVWAARILRSRGNVDDVAGFAFPRERAASSFRVPAGTSAAWPASR